MRARRGVAASAVRVVVATGAADVSLPAGEAAVASAGLCGAAMATPPVTAVDAVTTDWGVTWAGVR